jgi:hypothetical protein
MVTLMAVVWFALIYYKWPVLVRNSNSGELAQDDQCLNQGAALRGHRAFDRRFRSLISPARMKGSDLFVHRMSAILMVHIIPTCFT